MSIKPSREAADSGELHAAVAGLRAVLKQLREAVEGLTDEQYVQSPVGVFDASVGGHARHTIDHARLLLEHAEGGTVNYDQRDRDSDVERSRAAAIESLDRIDQQLKQIGGETAYSAVQVASTVSGDGDCVTGRSSFIRELVFVQSHTVHHNALIGAMIRTLGRPVPEQFGYAPSTLAFLKNNACAR